MYSNNDLLNDIVALKNATTELNLAGKVLKVQAHILNLKQSKVDKEAIEYWENVYSKLRGKQAMDRFKQGSKAI